MANLRADIPLQKRKILKKTFNSVSRMLIFCVFLSIFFYYWLHETFGELPTKIAENKGMFVFLWVLVVFALVLSRMFYQILYFMMYFYDIDENNVVIRKGVLSKREITLPFAKITDVYVDQDIADVALGLYDVHISTPTTESLYFAHIDGLNKVGSAKLRKIILDSVNRAAGQKVTV